MKKGLLVVILVLLLVGCSSEPIQEPTPTVVPTPTLSDLFKTQVVRFVEEASRLKSITEQGVNFVEYSQQLSEIRSIYDILDSLWVDDFEVKTQENVQKAIESWECAYLLWDLKINYKLSINEHDSSNEYFQDVYGCGGDDLLLVDIDRIVMDKDTGERRRALSIPYDENISILLSVASDYFEVAQPALLQIIQ